jgi:hypothetical protein
MLAINETLNPEDRILGHWLAWTNDIQRQLGNLRIRPARRIDVQFTPTEYHSDNAGDWRCMHASTTPDMIEQYDHYTEAVTGLPQPISYRYIEICDSCPAWYSNSTEEWHNELG